MPNLLKSINIPIETQQPTDQVRNSSTVHDDGSKAGLRSILCFN